MSTILAIGALDSSGNRSLAAYIDACRHFEARLYPAAACVVARGPSGRVKAVNAVPPSIIARQIDAVAKEIRPNAILAGMLARHQAVDVLAERIHRHELKNLVLQPVFGIGNRHHLMTAKGEKQTAKLLVGVSEVIIGNCQTLGILAGTNEHPEARLLEAGANWTICIDSDNEKATIELSGRNGTTARATVSLLTGSYEAQDWIAAFVAAAVATGSGAVEAVSRLQALLGI